MQQITWVLYSNFQVVLLFFYDTDNYNYKINTSNDLNKTINLTADYYRQSDNSNDVTMGLVKGMMEVVIQEE